VGPIFLEETVDGNIYQDIIITQFISLLEMDEHNCWIQQDDATCQMSNVTMTFLREFFSHHLVSKALWPTRSLDLSSLNFFLWGYLKGADYRTKLHTLEDLKTSTEAAITNITVATLRSVCKHGQRVHACIHEHRAQFKHLLLFLSKF
jgi:hypothetical protein